MRFPNRIFGVALLFVSGCGDTLNSAPTLAVANGQWATCQSNLGGYFLPRQDVVVTPSESGLSITKSGMSPDRSQVYCLDYLYSPWGENRIGVSRTDGLLTKVFTKFDSKAKNIADEVIKGVDALAQASLGAREGAQNAQAKKPSTDRSYTVDLFNRFELEQVNAFLKKEYGYCISLDGRDDPRVPEWHAQLCPGAPHYHKQWFAYSDQHFKLAEKRAQESQHKGVLYRPLVAHRLVVMRKNDPGDNLEAWHMAATEYVELPDRAPVFTLSVTRGFFTNTNTTVEFDSGILASVDTTKPSELNIAVDIPISVLKKAVALPGLALQIGSNEEKNREKIANNNARAIATLRSLDRQVKEDQAYAVQGPARYNTGRLVSGENTDSRAAIASESNCLDDQFILSEPDAVELCREILQNGN